MGEFLTFDQALVQNLDFLFQIRIKQVKFVLKFKLKPKNAYKRDGHTKSPIHHENSPKKDVHEQFYEFERPFLKCGEHNVVQHERTSCKLALRASLSL